MKRIKARRLLISIFLSKEISRRHSLPGHIKCCLLCRILESYRKGEVFIYPYVWKYCENISMRDKEIPLRYLWKKNLMESSVSKSLKLQNGSLFRMGMFFTVAYRLYIFILFLYLYVFKFYYIYTLLLFYGRNLEVFLSIVWIVISVCMWLLITNHTN